MKRSSIEKTYGSYKWKESNQLVALAQQYSQKIRGHTLVCRRPHCLKNLTSAQLNDTLKKHIDNVLTRYKGKIYAWGVVNEVIEDDGKFRKSICFKNLNETHISKAFY
jgi:endo-1,4-beta-xylanase